MNARERYTIERALKTEGQLHSNGSEFHKRGRRKAGKRFHDTVESELSTLLIHPRDVPPPRRAKKPRFSLVLYPPGQTPPHRLRLTRHSHKLLETICLAMHAYTHT